MALAVQENNPFPIEEIKAQLDTLKNKYPFSNDIDFMSKLKEFYSNENRERRIGRSYAMARILLEIALESNEIIYLIDHYDIYKNGLSHKGHIFHLIEDWQSKFYDMGIEIYLKFNYNSNNFTADFRDEKSEKLYNSFKLEYKFPVKKVKEFSNELLLLLIKI